MDRIIVGGSVVHSMPALIVHAGRILGDSGDPASPELLASALGAAAVTDGAIEHALGLVREKIFDLTPGLRV